jgi:UDP-N-acetylenolpyruvoylglucosamine reductase
MLEALIHLKHSIYSSRFSSCYGSELSTFSIGGSVTNFIETHSLSDLKSIVCTFNDSSLQGRYLGNGSNIVFPDEGIHDEPVIKYTTSNSKMSFLENPEDLFLLNDEYTISEHDNRTSRLIALLEILKNSKEYGKKYFFRIHGGSSLMSASRFFCDAGLHGLEFCAGIPGTIGGGVYMNAGAHGNEISSCLLSVHVMRKDGSFHTYQKSDLAFSYRRSGIPSGEIIVAADFELEHYEINEVKRIREEALSYRKRTQPLKFPSAGSVFRNPEGEILSAGALLESLGFKGRNEGGVSFSDLHANWIVKTSKNALAVDVKKLVDTAMEATLKHYGIILTPEILFWKV